MDIVGTSMPLGATWPGACSQDSICRAVHHIEMTSLADAGALASMVLQRKLL